MSLGVRGRWSTQRSIFFRMTLYCGPTQLVCTTCTGIACHASNRCIAIMAAVPQRTMSQSQSDQLCLNMWVLTSPSSRLARYLQLMQDAVLADGLLGTGGPASSG